MRSRELYDCQSGAANGFWAYDVERGAPHAAARRTRAHGRGRQRVDDGDGASVCGRTRLAGPLGRRTLGAPHTRLGASIYPVNLVNLRNLLDLLNLL